ncbi:hypothetical protein ACJ73_03253 [Blastomyces percursus]|uniref:Uncharacterized protein n=1 Tax=Blastomyces percursus TaxID=1658174 RepID=A0A1J9QAA5_9EURO|nr:hypothetical protein ACJ73_03253 [Blastomyces percursus]
MAWRKSSLSHVAQNLAPVGIRRSRPDDYTSTNCEPSRDASTSVPTSRALRESPIIPSPCHPVVE